MRPKQESGDDRRSGRATGDWQCQCRVLLLRPWLLCLSVELLTVCVCVCVCVRGCVVVYCSGAVQSGIFE